MTTSPSFTTPSLGVATATSLALGGSTIGTNALAVTGTTLLNNALTYGGVTLSNSVTGTGSMVLSSSPTLTSPSFSTIVNIGTAGVHHVATGISVVDSFREARQRGDFDRLAFWIHCLAVAAVGRRADSMCPEKIRPKWSIA